MGTKPPNGAETTTRPKAFISYSWTSQEHRERILSWANRLRGDGVDVVLDQYDLAEGHDKYAFMEQMVTDPSVTHVLLCCDRQYAEKADARQAGVGTETQIVTPKLYARAKQSKFVPIACEVDASGQPFLPAFLSSCIAIMFHSAEHVNANWEQLVRCLYGKPRLVKPELGAKPAYLDDSVSVAQNTAASKLASLKQAIVVSHPRTGALRKQFVAACVEAAAAQRMTEFPAHTFEEAGALYRPRLRELRQIRSLMVDWVLFEADSTGSGDFAVAVCDALGWFLRLTDSPSPGPQDAARAPLRFFVHETMLYTVAALMQCGRPSLVHEVLRFPYHFDEGNRVSARLANIGDFFCSDRELQFATDSRPSNGSTWKCPGGTLIKEHADIAELPLDSLIVADFVLTLHTHFADTLHWWPLTAVYVGMRTSPLSYFVRASHRLHAEELKVMLGASSVGELRARLLERVSTSGVAKWLRQEAHLDLAKLTNLTELGVVK